MQSADRPLYRHAEMRRLLDPQSVAVIGASTRAGSFGERVLNNMRDFGGRIYPVNARYDRIGERTCYPSVGALPEVPDCAVIAVPREAAEPIIAECATAGVGGAILFASGYAEMGTPERIAEQDRIAVVARAARMPLVGPNCIGVMNSAQNARITFMMVEPPPELRQCAIGLISQSGALGFSLAQAAARGVPFSHVLTSGNSCDVDMADYVAYLAEEPTCAAIACVFEGMAAPRRLLHAAKIARQADKPLVVFKMATGEQGAAAAMSHTGSLAGSHATYQAAFREAGVILVDDYEDLIDTAHFFAKAPAPAAPGIAILATSGGAAIMAADRAEQYGVPLPQPQEATRGVLEAHIPEFGSPRNPCDVTAQVMNQPESLGACANALLRDASYAALVVPQVYSYAPGISRIPMYEKLAGEAGKIICTVWANEYLGGPGARETELCRNVALFRSTENCFATLAAWQRRQARRAALSETASRIAPAEARETAGRRIDAAAGRTLTEREAKSVLALYGIPVVGERLARSAEEAVGAAEELGLPAVLKAESPDLPHKTEAGVIRLNLKTPGDVLEAYAAIMERAEAARPRPRVNGVLVQPMVPQGVELVVGGRIEPLFGPLVLVGLGGILVELMQDTALAPAPVSPGRARALLSELKGFRLLTGFRNLPAVNLDRLAELIGRVSELLADQQDRIAELDINPLICVGERMVAVDALIVRSAHPPVP